MGPQMTLFRKKLNRGIGPRKFSRYPFSVGDVVELRPDWDKLPGGRPNRSPQLTAIEKNEMVPGQPYEVVSEAKMAGPRRLPPLLLKPKGADDSQIFTLPVNQIFFEKSQPRLDSVRNAFRRLRPKAAPVQHKAPSFSAE